MRICRLSRNLYLPLAVFFLVLAGCSSSGPTRRVDPELNTLNSAGLRAYRQAQFEPAARFYLRALNRARQMDDPERIGTAAYNLALCRYLLEDYDAAVPLLDQARAAYRRLGPPPADLILLEARTAYQLDEMDRARQLADEGLNREDDPDRIGFLVLKGMLNLEGGDIPGAREYLDRATRLRDEETPPLSAADIAGLAGRVLSAEGDHAAAGRAFDRRAAALREAGRYREMARALGSAGDAYARVPDPTAAADRYFRSARSLSARGDLVEAVKMLEPAVAAAGASDDEYLRGRVVELFEELKEKVDAAGEDENVQ